MLPSTDAVLALRWQDVDAYGHVHTVSHLALLEDARMRFFDQVFAVRQTWDYAVVHLEIDFLAELLPSVERQAKCRIVPIKIGTKAITTREEIFAPDGAKASAARCVCVPWDRKDHASRPLSSSERSALAQYLISE